MAGNRILYFYLLLLAGIFFVLFDLYLFHLLLVFLLLLPAVSLLIALPVSRTLRYRIDAEDDIVPKGNCSIGLTVQNSSFLPCAYVRVRLMRRNALGRVKERYTESFEDAVQFSIAPKQMLSLRPTARMAYCGRVDFLVQQVRVCDMLGVFSLPVPKKNELNGACSVYVMPELQSRAIETPDTADLGLDSSTYSTEKPGGDPSEIFQLRDYRPGDARHSIHWKLSSRMDRLIVREFGLPLNPSLHFLLELRSDATPAEAEHLIGSTLALSEYLMAREIAHCISWLGEDGTLRTASISGTDALASALHELLALPGQKRWSALVRFALQQAQPETSLVYLIAGTLSKPAEDSGAEQLLSGLTDLGVCREVTLMPDRCPPEAADRFRGLGCDVQLMDGSIPGLEAEAAL